MLVSDRELNNNTKSHVDQNDKLNMSLLKETCCAHRVQFRSSVHFSKFVMSEKSLGWCMTFHPLFKFGHLVFARQTVATSQAKAKHGQDNGDDSTGNGKDNTGRH